MRFLVVVYFMLVFPVYALDVDIKIDGDVVIPPCIINGGVGINIDFKSIDGDKIDGINYAQEKTIPINCGYYSGTPYIQITGSKLLRAPDNVLRATIAGNSTTFFGLAFYQGSTISSAAGIKISDSVRQPVTAGLSAKNSASSNFTFVVVPYAINSVRDINGDFSATASMTFIYL